MKSKKGLTVLLTGVMALSMSLTAFAGQWMKDDVGYWWKNIDGTYPVSSWQWLDGNNDGIAECYYFNESGYILTNTTTPDGYQVNSDGAWIQNGVVVTRLSEGENYTSDSIGTGTLEPKIYDGIEFSIENLGVSDMAIGAIMYPSANKVTAQHILEKKAFYETGTDDERLTATQRNVVDNFVSQWVSQHIDSSMSDEEISETIFNWLVENVSYDDNASNPQSSYGALIDKRCVCEGYANAFMRLGKACGLDVKFILTSNHAFNLVKLSEKWYLVDPTQNYYKDKSSTGVYYMHTIPEGEISIEEKKAERLEKQAGRGDEVALENESNLASAEMAKNKGFIFYADDSNLIQNILDLLYEQIEGFNHSQGIEMLLYTGNREFKEFNKLTYNYNGFTGRIDDVLEAAMEGQNVNGFTIGDTSSCTIRWLKDVGSNGSVYVNTFKDDAGNDFVLIDFNINPQR